ncbi:MAG: hypothetical protein HKN43_12390 [Rhodothermales bacterium]|nr:hypothetical protein [Rhodothermales bacterium]
MILFLQATSLELVLLIALGPQGDSMETAGRQTISKVSYIIRRVGDYLHR